MKGKTRLCLTAILLVATLLASLSAVRALPGTSLEIIFLDTGTSTLIGPPPNLGEEFTVALHVTGVTDLWSWIVQITWAPDILDVAKDPVTDLYKIEEGPFMKSVSGTVFLFKAPEPGYIREITCCFLATIGATGSGDLAYITFVVEGFTGVPGSGIDITISSYDFIDKAEIPITFEAVTNGYFELAPPPPTAPQAIFTPATCSLFYVGESITLDGSASKVGWDTLPSPGNTCPITEYKWEIDFLNGTILTLYGDYIENAFTCEALGDVNINLTIYAPDPVPDTHPDYYPYDSEVHVIHQITKPVGPIIDVYTEKGGEGPGIDPATGLQFDYPTSWSDAFEPQEEVTVYAKVTYNDDPVENQPVSFAMIDETGAAVDFRTAFTDEFGIATTSFRLIWEDDKTFEEKFEVWEIWASVSVSEIEKKDVVNFRYGWLVQIDAVNAPGEAHKCMDVPITVDLNNIAYTAKTVFVTVVIYDDCGVPIGLATLLDWTVFADDGLTSELTIHIPDWAYLGTGTIYVNLFTAPPQEGGVPVCPEGSAIIILGQP